ncbi:hypothetical protein RBB50_010214 [Rhinocladiella similis]
MRSSDWRQRSIYQIVTDRFALSEGTTPKCGLREYCGGTWKGIESRLDYIAGMGFDAIWISPVIHNLEENTTWGHGYHGYWGDDPFRLNDNFGTVDDLRSLSDALHARKMALMVDVVINHLAINQHPDQLDYSHFPEPFNSPFAFHPNCPINYNDQKSVEDCWLVDSQVPLLADVNTENPDIFDAIVKSVVDLVQTYSIDGIRLDTARHVPQRHLQRFQEAVNVFVTGEVLDRQVEYVAQYQRSMDSVLNYPLYFAINEVFAGNATFDTLQDVLDRERASFLDSTVLGNFLDNHDQARFASKTGSNITNDMNALTFTMLTPGIPIIYYGFEQRLQGEKDPENRAPLWSSGYNTEAPLYQLLAKLNAIKNIARSSDTKSFFDEDLGHVLAVSNTTLACQRGPLVIVVSKAQPDNDNNTTGIQLPRSTFIEGTRLIDLIGCEATTTAGVDGSFTVLQETTMPQIWAPEELAGGFCF